MPTPLDAAGSLHSLSATPPWMQGQSLPDEFCELAEVMESYGLPTLGYAPRAASEERASQKVHPGCICLHQAQCAHLLGASVSSCVCAVTKR